MPTHGGAADAPAPTLPRRRRRAGSGPQTRRREAPAHDLALLHRPPRLRDGAVRRHHADRRDRPDFPADRAVPTHHAAGRRRVHQLSRRQRSGRGRHRGGADRAGGQRRRGHALHVLPDGQRRHLLADRHLRRGHGPEDGPGHGAEPRDAGHAAAAEPGAEPGHHHPEEDSGHPDDRQFLLAGRPLRRHLPEQLRHDQRQGRAAARAGRVGRHLPGRARLQHPLLAGPAEAGGVQDDRDGRGQRHPHPEPGRAGRPGRTAAGPRRQGFQLPIDTLGRLNEPEQFGDIIVKVGPRGGGLRSVNRRRPPTSATSAAAAEPGSHVDQQLGERQYDAPTAPRAATHNADHRVPHVVADLSSSTTTTLPAARRHPARTSTPRHGPERHDGRRQHARRRDEHRRRHDPRRRHERRRRDGQRLRRSAAWRTSAPRARACSAARRWAAAPAFRRAAVVRLRDVAPHRAGRPELHPILHLRRPSVGGPQRLPAARHQRARRGRRRPQENEGAEYALSRRRELRHRLRHDAVHPRVGPGRR